MGAKKKTFGVPLGETLYRSAVTLIRDDFPMITLPKWGDLPREKQFAWNLLGSTAIIQWEKAMEAEKAWRQNPPAIARRTIHGKMRAGYCRHGKKIGSCDECDFEADTSFDAAREDRVFGRGV